MSGLNNCSKHVRKGKKIEKKTIEFLLIIYGITIIYLNNVKAIETEFRMYSTAD